MSILILISIFSFLSFAQLNIGHRIDFFKSEGNPKFGVQLFENALMMTFSVNGFELSNKRSVTSVAAQFVNLASGEPLSSSIELMKTPSGVFLQGIQAFTLSVKGLSVQKITKEMKNSAIVLLTTLEDGGVSKAYIDLGAYCQTDSGHFVNLDSGETGCHN